MSEKQNRRINITLSPAVIIVFISSLFLSTVGLAQESKSYIGIHIPTAQDPRVPIDERDRFLGLHMDGSRSPVLQSKVRGIKRDASIDSTGQNINFTETLNSVDFRVPTYLTLADYIDLRRRQDIDKMWMQKIVGLLGEKGGYGRRGGGGGLRIDIPVEIKSKAFQKIFGSGTVGLDVSGDITINGGFRNENRSEVKTAYNRGSDNTFKMEQTQRFKVQGHIGEKVTIAVDQDSERAFDFENNIRLKYEGYDDEIIQSIEAGNISLSLPGTRFVTFGGKSSGLFGVKTALTLGNLNLIAIASQEKGEKKKLSLKGGATEEDNKIQDYQYKKGTYYFLDEIYRQNYVKLRNPESGELGADINHIIGDIEVYKSEPNYQQKYSQSIRGWAIVKDDDSDWQITPADTANVDPEHYLGYFLRLEKNQDYFIHPELGYIRMNIPASSGQVLAIAYRDSSGRIQGDINFNPDESNNVVLRLLKTQNPLPSDKTWDLEWKHVYNLGGRNIPREGFEARIYFKPSSGDPQETITDADGNSKTYLEVFGLDNIDESGVKGPDNLIDIKDNIIDFQNGELWFPDIRPFDPVDEKFKALLPEEKRAAAIYDTTVQSVINAASNFYIEVSSKRQSSEYRLGMNVIENSETVTLNGRPLNRGTDYTIDYFTGTLRVLNEEASSASANIDISYESNQLFQIDKKTVIGARAEYGLWNESFIGATFLYLNESTLDQKIRVGKGPMRNLVWDINTSLSFKPQFLTRAANWLPFVDTRAPSSIKFEGEFAEVIPNPNTRNNSRTDDNDGVAYIDDFEAAKRVTPIPITKESWEYCSQPYGDSRTIEDIMQLRGDFIYYNPYTQYPIKQIWPNKDINANVAQTINIMTMRFKPPDNYDDLNAGDRNYWNGIQRSLSAGYYNQTETKFLEIWVQGQKGTVHIDMGQISEDIIPNRRLDTEDKANSSGYRNGILDDGEDVGMDGMSNSDPRAVAAGGDFWDIDGDGVRSVWEPFSNDNWSFNGESRPVVYDFTNGTESNANDGLRIPDTEDMNGNGSVDLRNDYFEFTFSLGDNHPDSEFIVGKSVSNETGIDYGWRQYRIPLDAPSPTLIKTGNPNLSLVEYVRIWVDGFEDDSTHFIQIAEINLVGSEWKEGGVATEADPELYDIPNDSTVKVTVINTHDNPTNYTAPPGVKGEVDRITDVEAREQSMVLDVKGLLPLNNGIATKTFFDSQDYINYNTMKMFVYGKDEWGTHISADSTKIEFFLRFGSDQNNYYEIREPVYSGWSKNNIEIDLVELSSIKLLESFRDTSVTDYDLYRKDIGGGRTLTVRGKPALRNVRMLIAGVKNNHETQPFYGEVWLNELRLSNVKKDKGTAMRARLDFAVADLLRFNGEINQKDADFHNVATRFGTGNNEVSGNFNTSLSVGKFLPAKWGLSLPVNFNYAKSESSPKYIPGTDVEVNDALPDSTLESIKTLNEKKGFSVSLKINPRSQNFFIKHIVQPFSASYSTSNSDGSNSRNKYTRNTSESGSVNWGLTFSRENYIRPFKMLEVIPLLGKVSETKLYYTPQKITTQHSGTRTKNEAKTRTNVETRSRSFNINRNYSTNIKIFESLVTDISRKYTHDLRDVQGGGFFSQLSQGELGYLTKLNQSSSVKYNPKLFTWFSPNVNYTVGFNYGYNRQQTLAPRSATRNKSLTVSGNLNIATFFKSIYRPNASSGRSRKKNSPAKPARTGPQKADPKKTDQKKTNKKGGGFSVLGLVASGFNIFQPINVSYSNRTNLSTYGIAGMPSTGFQFGWSDSLGVPLESSDTGSGSVSTSRPTSSENTTFSASTGLAISRNVKLNLKYDQSNSLNSSAQTTGQRSKSWLLLSDGKGFLFPGWTFNVSGLEKLSFLKTYVQRITFEHGHSGRFNETFDVENTIENVTREDRDSQYRPLIGVMLAMKNGISMNVRYNQTEKISLSKGFGVGATRNMTSELSFSGKYSKRGNFRIPVWPFNNMKLKNNVDISLTFSMSENTTEKNKSEGEFEVTGETSKWYVKPNMTYSFSDRVSGGAHFEIGKIHNKLTGDTSYKELGIDVRIQIRGN